MYDRERLWEALRPIAIRFFEDGKPVFSDPFDLFRIIRKTCKNKLPHEARDKVIKRRLDARKPSLDAACGLLELQLSSNNFDPQALALG